MSVKTEIAKRDPTLTDSFEADGDLSDFQYCFVAPSEQSSGKTQIKAPTGQGVLCIGVLTDESITDASVGSVTLEGIEKVKASAAFNAGVELTVAGTAGTVEAASSGDYVVGISREASAEAGHLVSVWLTKPYQKK